jgi:hypothetical protein
LDRKSAALSRTGTFRKNSSTVLLDYGMHDEKTQASPFKSRHYATWHAVEPLEDPF